MPTIKIESILGGQGEYHYFTRDDQFGASFNLDPDLPSSDTGDFSLKPSGLLRPSPVQTYGLSTTILAAPMWIESNPKDANYYVYDVAGSLYAGDSSHLITAVSDGGTLGSSSGNGCAYYDNYLYLAKNTDIARYGPLNGSAAFTGTYWTGTLSKTALVNTTYPYLNNARVRMPNHVLHRHQDGRLYIADVVTNRGTIHYISTSRTSAEGDTDNGSTYAKLTLGYGDWITALESYGTDIAIAVMENQATATRLQRRAKLYFWDTVSTNYNKEVEFPDPVISAMRYDPVTGVLYVFSGQLGKLGTRVSRFVGGYLVQQIAYIHNSQPPFAGAVENILNRTIFGGTSSEVPNASFASVWALGSATSLGGKGIFNIMATPSTRNSSELTCLKVINQSGFSYVTPITGWTDGTEWGLDRQVSSYNTQSIWRSKTYRVGQPFTIDRIRFPLQQAVASGMTVTPKIVTDNGTSSTTLVAINSTNFPNSEKNANIRVSEVRGEHDFYIELTWSGSALLTIGLPITIDFSLVED